MVYFPLIHSIFSSATIGGSNTDAAICRRHSTHQHCSWERWDAIDVHTGLSICACLRGVASQSNAMHPAKDVVRTDHALPAHRGRQCQLDAARLRVHLTTAVWVPIPVCVRDHNLCIVRWCCLFVCLFVCLSVAALFAVFVELRLDWLSGNWYFLNEDEGMVYLCTNAVTFAASYYIKWSIHPRWCSTPPRAISSIRIGHPAYPAPYSTATIAQHLSARRFIIPVALHWTWPASMSIGLMSTRMSLSGSTTMDCSAGHWRSHRM